MASAPARFRPSVASWCEASRHRALCARSSAIQPRQSTLRVRAIGVPPDAPPPPPPPPPPRRTRLAASVISAPRQLDVYFEGSLYRRALWTCIAFAAGVAAVRCSIAHAQVSVGEHQPGIVGADTCGRPLAASSCGQTAQWLHQGSPRASVPGHDSTYKHHCSTLHTRSIPYCPLMVMRALYMPACSSLLQLMHRMCRVLLRRHGVAVLRRAVGE